MMNRQIKVLHVITGLGDGGAEAVLYRLISHDASADHQVVSLTDDGKYGALLRELGVEVIPLGMPRGIVTRKGVSELWRIMRAYQPSLVQTWMYHADLVGGIVGRIARIPVVWGVHNTVLEVGKSSLRTRLVRRLSSMLSGSIPYKIVTCSSRALETHCTVGYSRDRMVVVTNGVDSKEFHPDEQARSRLRAEWGIAATRPIIGMVARFDPYKDHSTLLEALAIAAKTRNFVAVLVGSGMISDNEELRHLILKFQVDDRIILTGPRNDIPAVMNALDLHVLSSSAESFGNVIVEAMACGTPCVVTDVGESRAIVGDTGWVVPPRNARALASALCEALDAMTHCAHWNKRKSKCRARVLEQFGIEAMVRGYQSVWRDVAESADQKKTARFGIHAIKKDR
jgi:glycosyltransferase involved in cell wall biosynthesis